MSSGKDKFSLHAAKRLKAERERLFPSQEEAGLACGVSRVMWGQYERGQAAPGGNVWLKLAEKGADLKYILTGDGEGEPRQVNQNVAPYGLKPDEVELLDNYRRSPPDGRDVIQKTSAAFARESAVVVGGIPPKKRPGPTITGEAQKSVQKKETKSE